MEVTDVDGEIRVRLEKSSNGNEISLSRKQLSEADRQFIDDYLAEQNPPEVVTPEPVTPEPIISEPEAGAPIPDPVTPDPGTITLTPGPVASATDAVTSAEDSTSLIPEPLVDPLTEAATPGDAALADDVSSLEKLSGTNRGSAENLIAETGKSVLLPERRPSEIPDSSLVEPPASAELETPAVSRPKGTLVEIDPAAIAALPPRLAQILSVLDNDRSKRADRIVGLQLLSKEWPSPASPVIIDVVSNLAAGENPDVRAAAVVALAQRAPIESLPMLIERLDDANLEVRWLTLRMLASIDDPRVLPELIKRFDSPDRKRVSVELKKFGAAAESSLLPLLDSDQRDVVLDLCNLLSTIGTQAALPKLDELTRSADTLMVKVQSRTTAKKIRARINAKQQ